MIGNLCLTTGPTRALVLVIDTIGTDALVALACPDVEFASATDVVLLGRDSGLAYDLIIHADIHAVVPQVTLGRTLTVARQAASAVVAIRDDEGVGAGPAAWLRSDPRWAHQVGEVGRLRSGMRLHHTTPNMW